MKFLKTLENFIRSATATRFKRFKNSAKKYLPNTHGLVASDPRVTLTNELCKNHLIIPDKLTLLHKCRSGSSLPIMAIPQHKSLRHAQTQHSAEPLDLDNIFLHKAMLKEELKKSDEQCTWFYDVDPSLLSTTNDQFLSSKAGDGQHKQILEKRKPDNAEHLITSKKPKLESNDNEKYEETSYYMENDLRKVYPYLFTFTTYTKGRWVGEKILEVFAREFRAQPEEEYKRSIEVGTLTVNHEKVPIDYRLKHNDLLANTVHRHEVPVTSQPIKIVHMDKDIIVVNKPPSIPVHPCGRYRHNTVVFILAKEFNLRNLRTIHRLDRLTSGLLLFGRTPNKARQLEQQIRNRQVQKEYVCRVEGNFPDGVVECKEPIAVVSYKIGVCKVSPTGKDCQTTFEKISQVGNWSIILCKPLTGRMHQIRVHLQFLGYPIANDPLYNHTVFGCLKGRGGDIGGKSDEELINDLIHVHNAENWLGIDTDSDLPVVNSVEGANSSNGESAIFNPNIPVSNSNDLDAANLDSSKLQTTNKKPVAVSSQTGLEVPDQYFDPNKMTTHPHCNECKINYRDPTPKELSMYLHAWKYKGPGWEYETDLPDWASPNWTEST
ncbi:RNA pseudouridylate synthase domain-containing protein 2 isoform X2 [Scaptodrosophila lebanonensis]|uniref:Pseudouridylate synthase RPUSD2 n=1 Tax=Drosophila lebanonensis TaxID=7225 RepID=A0A6J2UCA8_DROLE|nr:RNA pseudouridylate synthase domain-containing protein 2 isoform X2 [Scaptodrosophila lebanonensis]